MMKSWAQLGPQLSSPGADGKEVLAVMKCLAVLPGGVVGGGKGGGGGARDRGGGWRMVTTLVVI